MNLFVSRTNLEWAAIEGDSPVCENKLVLQNSTRVSLLFDTSLTYKVKRKTYNYGIPTSRNDIYVRSTPKLYVILCKLFVKKWRATARHEKSRAGHVKSCLKNPSPFSDRPKGLVEAEFFAMN